MAQGIQSRSHQPAYLCLKGNDFIFVERRLSVHCRVVFSASSRFNYQKLNGNIMRTELRYPGFWFANQNLRATGQWWEIAFILAILRSLFQLLLMDFTPCYGDGENTPGWESLLASISSSNQSIITWQESCVTENVLCFSLSSKTKLIFRIMVWFGLPRDCLTWKFSMYISGYLSRRLIQQYMRQGFTQ